MVPAAADCNFALVYYNGNGAADDQMNVIVSVALPNDRPARMVFVQRSRSYESTR
ncbi:MAG: hypothetical protein WBZ01_11205 [Terriglobales bacterium]|jgi:hypothetical protein